MEKTRLVNQRRLEMIRFVSYSIDKDHGSFFIISVISKIVLISPTRVYIFVYTPGAYCLYL